MNTFKVVTGVLFIACAASTSARAVPFIKPVFGTPVVGIDFANPLFNVSVNSNLSAFSDGLYGSATIDLAEPAPAALIVLSLILLLIGLPWSAGRRQVLRGEAP
ncbi:hypothetical protein GGE65_000685 [Skermanella aerolata]|uniref:hypothetical protein n=1 Tax=Skermanella aerolata TaxID=393310 RepID=UPI003D2083C2